MIYIRTSEKNILHTIILKEQHDEFTYICAIGYGGGGVFEEFCGKFYWDDNDEGLRGFCASYHDPDEWEKEVFENEVLNEDIVLIKNDERQIIRQMVEKIWNEYLLYDENTDTRLVRDTYLPKSKQDLYLSDNWDAETVDFVSNNHWGLLLQFDY
jgi:hypothetical protein